jgi:hypothetical protein
MALKMSPAIDERAIQHFAQRDPKTGAAVSDDALDPLVDAMKHAREEAARLVQVEQASMADASLPRAAALLQVANAALKSGQRVAAKLDAARGKAKAELAALDKRTGCPPPPRDAVALGLEQEIRARLAAMPESERKDAIDQAFTERNEAVIGAVLRGPAMLVGMSPARHNVVRARYQTEFHGVDMQRRERIAKALDAVERGGTAFMGIVRAAADDPAARIAAERKEKRDAALAAHSKEA